MIPPIPHLFFTEYIGLLLGLENPPSDVMTLPSLESVRASVLFVLSELLMLLYCPVLCLHELYTVIIIIIMLHSDNRQWVCYWTACDFLACTFTIWEYNLNPIVL